MRAAIRLELRRMRGLVGWTALAAVAYGGIVSGFYPTFRDNQKLVEQYMRLFSKELLAIFGMQGSLADPGNFFNMYIGGMLWPIVAAIVAIALATRPAADLEHGFLELPLATRLSRVRYLGATILGQAVGLAILAVATISGILAIGWVVGAPFDTWRFVLAGIHAFGFGIVLAAGATLLTTLTLDRGRAAGIAVGLILGMYLLDAASKVWTNLGAFAELSAFHHFRTTEIIDTGAFPAGDFVLFLAVAAVAWLVALFVFRRRDLAA
jgi:hypothetical protein